ncbi:sigma-70 family RNA polymerase sigma factor [Fodinicola acaciae]|uniref:sigma-70 family RNA polymerase sigma factor n=1 Tax=Fodinicola acaciae TaxID=2681555 RepID=UPI0013D31815|nr:sigma-70 family RNA polymerase sigma factor [Fodinicola acaciae]
MTTTDGARSDELIPAADSLEDIFKASYSRLVVAIYPLAGDLNEAQDAVQEAFARAMARRSRVLAADNPEAYLHTVARNVVRTWWRRRLRLARRLDLAATDVSTALPPSPDRVALLRALAQIPAAQREVLVRFYFADHSIEEIARALGVSVGTVKSRLHRGRAAMAQLVDETGDELRPDVAAAIDQVRTEVGAAAGAPDLTLIDRRGRRLQARRRAGMAAGTAAIAAAAAALVTVVSLAGGWHPAPITSDNNRPSTVAAALVGSRKSRSFLPVDETRAYAVVELKDKRYALAETADAGEHWQAHKLPSQLLADLGKYQPLVLGPKTVLIGTYLTKDGGQTWHRGEPSTARTILAPPSGLKPGAPIQAVPAGWPLARSCDRACLVAIDPTTGVPHEVLNTPVRAYAVLDSPNYLIHSAEQLWFNADGPHLNYSLDGGRSWRQLPYSQGSFSVAVNGRYVYVVMDHDVEGSMVVRSLDGGKNWEPAATDALTSQGDVCALADGTLLGIGLNRGHPHGGVQVSHDHGATFTSVDPVKASGIWRTLTGACVLGNFAWAGRGPLGTNKVWTTTDGDHFREIPLPAPLE